MLNRLAWIASFALGLSLYNFIAYPIFGFFASIFGFSMSFGTFLMHIVIVSGISAGIKGIFLPQRLCENITSMRTKKKIRKEEPLPTEESFQDETTYALPEIALKKPIAREESILIRAEKLEPSKPNIVARWFSENTLAKIGGILIFVALVAFLSVIYTQIGPVGRLVISVCVALSIYAIGIFLYHRTRFIQESQIVLGVGIASVYLSIIYIFRVPIFVASFGDTLPYIVLTLLTIAVLWGAITGILYGAIPLFIFSIAIAFLNPYLIHAGLSTTQMLVYIILISGSAFLTAYQLIKNSREKIAQIVLLVAYIGGMLLALFVDKSTSWSLNGTIVTMLLLSIGMTQVGGLLQTKAPINLGILGCAIGIFLALIDAGLVQEIAGAIILVAVIVCLFLLTLRHVEKIGKTILMILFVLPIVLWLIGYGIGFWPNPIIAFSGCIVFYAIFLSIFRALPVIFSSVLLLICVLVGFFCSPQFMPDLSLSSYFILLFTGLFLFGYGIVFALRNNLPYTATAHTILSLWLVCISRPDIPSIWMIFIMAILSIITIFVCFYSLKKTLLSSFDHIAIPIIGAGFLIGTLIYFGAQKANWGIMLGGIFMAVALGYFGIFSARLQSFKKPIPSYFAITFLGLIISIITLGIAYLFSGRESARTIAWIIEAGLLMAMYRQNNALWFLIGAVIVQCVGMAQFGIIGPTISSYPGLFVVTLLGILWGIGNLRNKNTTQSWPAEIIFSISAMIVLVYGVHGLPNEIWTQTGKLLLTETYIMLFVLISAYSFQKILFSILVFCEILFLINFSESLEVTKWICLVAPFVLMLSQFVFAKIHPGIFSRVNWFVTGIGSFVTSSIWISGHFTNEYMLTIWWTLWTFALLAMGIKNTVPLLRSLGLTVYTLTLCKIVFFDLGQIFTANVESGVYIGISIIMLLGIVSIGLSMLYKKILGDGALMRDFMYRGGGEGAEFNNMKQILKRNVSK